MGDMGSEARGPCPSATESTNRTRPMDPIAICGMSMRLPGGIKDAQAFWSALIEKRELRCPVPADRFNIDAYHNRHGKPGTVLNREAFYLSDQQLGHFDSAFFGVGPQELPDMDPQQQMILELTQECLENAGEVNWRGKRVGCYVGTFGEDWIDLGAKDTLHSSIYRQAGQSDFALSNRTSHEFDFRGPSMTIKSACSSAMLSLNEACWAISSGQCDSAVVAGCNLIMTPTMTTSIGPVVLSPSGTCKTFDAEADGYARGEAVNALFIKRLSNAIEDGNAIRAVIRGIGVNSDGGTSAGLTPSSISQEDLILRTYAQANLPLHETGFFECHGTGTRVGDPIEANVVSKLFGDQGIIIGASKPNFGHSEGASAITSIIKAVIALEKKAIPPNMRFSKPNPKIQFGTGRMIVPTEAIPWPAGREERVSVNSFGITGANGHVIIESTDSWIPKPINFDNIEWPKVPELLVLSAKLENSLTQLKDFYRTLSSKQSIETCDLAHTLGARRNHHRYRTFAVTSGEEDEVEFSPTVSTLLKAKLVYVFTGQGASWPRMAIELLEQNQTFRNKMQHLEKVMSGLPECTFSMEEELRRPSDQSRLGEAEISQPLSTAVQMCLYDALKASGVIPEAVVGHSSGEIAAAYAAGALTDEEAIKTAFYRGQAIKTDTSSGAMVSVGLGKDVVERLPLHGANIACENSPVSVTLSGEKKQVEAAIESIEEQHPTCLIKMLKVDKSYHSHRMRPIGRLYQAMLQDRIRGSRARIPFFSSLMGRRLDDCDTLGPEYWSAHLESPVLFRDAVKHVVSSEDSNFIFAEIGAQPTLGGALLQICSETKARMHHVSFMKRLQHSTETFLTGMGHLYQLGISLDFHSLTRGSKTLTDLPNYPWNHDKRHWNENRLCREWRFRKYPHHDLLGSKTLESSSIEPSWRNVLKLDNVPWIKDHKIGSDVVLPFAAYCTMAGEAIQQVHGQRGAFTVSHVVVESALLIGSDDGVEIVTALKPARLTDSLNSAWYEFTIASHNGSQWTKHCNGSVMIGRIPTMVSERSLSEKKLPRKVDRDVWYKTVAGIGLNYGLCFQGLRAIAADVHDHKASATVKDNVTELDSPYQLHPSTIDCALQLVGVAASQGLAKNVILPLVPTRVDEMYVDATKGGIALLANAVISTRGVVTGDVNGSFEMADCFHMRGLSLVPFEDLANQQRPDPHAAAELVWAPDIELLNTSRINPEDERGKITAAIEYVRLLAHSNPVMNILDLGSSITFDVLQALNGDSDGRSYSTYTLTSSSASSLSTAKKQFQRYKGLDYGVINMLEDPLTQGFSPGTFDLVLTASGLKSEEAISKINMLLRPTIRALSGTHETDISSSKFVFGLEETTNSEAPVGTEATTFAKASPLATDCGSVVLLCSSKSDSVHEQVRAIFQDHGVDVEDSLLLGGISKTPLKSDTIVSIVDLQSQPVLQNISSSSLTRLKDLIQDTSRNIIWLARPCQIACTNPSYGTILGLARTARTELNSRFCTFELDLVDTGAHAAIWKVFNKLTSQLKDGAEGALDPEWEYAFHQGQVQIPRFRPANLDEQLKQPKSLGTDDAGTQNASLQVGIPGRLDTLHWKSIQPTKPLPPTWVEVQIKAVGVNFKDVLISMGILDSNANGLGLEGSGIVTSVGSEVERFKPGDKVMFASQGAFCLSGSAPEHLICKIPDGVSFQEAATVPCVYLTALYALRELSRLQKGESILIHSGCGGVGLAAIQLCQMIGAEIFVTVSNETKVQHLMQTYGILRHHIFDSRSPFFYSDLMRQTKGRGVDVVLNSLSGELLHASWKCVASFGRMIDIGKRDFLEFGKLDMNPFEGNRTYCGLSLDEVGEKRKDVTRRMFSELFDLLEQGFVKPITPMTIFSHEAIEECFRSMPKGQHIGKMIVDMPENADELNIQRQRKELRLDPNASYLLAGGFGGIGVAIARWLAENGVKHLLFLSRTAGQLEDHIALLDELEAMGCTAKAVACDVSDETRVQEVLSGHNPPIKGVIQASMVLKDQSIPNMTLEDWNSVLEPKVQGTWNVHNALLQAHLDFFVVLSSMSGIIGQHGQSNYNAANTFLDAFVQYRHGIGLPASALDIGAVGDIGTLRSRPDLLRHMQESGAHLLYEQEILDAVHWAVHKSTPLSTHPSSAITLGLRSTLPLQDPSNHLPWTRDRRMSLYHNLTPTSLSSSTSTPSPSSTASARLLLTLEKIHADPDQVLSDPETARILAEEIGVKIFSILGRPTHEEVKVDVSLATMGLDSLSGMEMKRWWRDVFHTEINILQVATAGTLEGLGKLAVAGLKQKLVK